LSSYRLSSHILQQILKIFSPESVQAWTRLIMDRRTLANIPGRLVNV